MPNPIVNRRILTNSRGVPLPFANIPQDDFELYSDGAAVNGLNLGKNGNHLFTIVWLSAYADRLRPFGVQALDNIESYSDGVALNGLNGGLGFAGAYSDRTRPFGLLAQDNIESYSDGAALNGLNGGSGFSGSYANHNN